MVFFFPSFLGSTAQLRPWPPPQNQLNFLEASQQFSFLQGRVVSPMPNPHPGGPGLCIYIPHHYANLMTNNMDQTVYDVDEMPNKVKLSTFN
jgi:hypothetical protein